MAAFGRFEDYNRLVLSCDVTLSFTCGCVCGCVCVLPVNVLPKIPQYSADGEKNSDLLISTFHHHQIIKEPKDQGNIFW